MSNGSRWSPALGLLLSTLACDGTDALAPVRCSVAGITGGTSLSQYLALSPLQTSAIVQIYSEGEGTTSSCTGTAVSDHFVLTAAHCVPNEAADVIVVFGAPLVREISLSRLLLHPTQDLALLELDEETSEGLGVVPISVPSPELDPPQIGDLVEMSGFGYSESGIGVRKFAVTRIATIGADTFVTDADRRAAACGGDSGGPALVRNEFGEVVLVGVLTSGSGSCAETDTFLFVPSFLEWLAENGVQPIASEAPNADCAQLGDVGRCFQDVALWCDGDTALSQSCQDGHSCGYSHSDGGFRCVPPETDPCQGVSHLGKCNGDDQISCVDGQVVVAPCATSDATCQFSVLDGTAICNLSGH